MTNKSIIRYLKQALSATSSETYTLVRLKQGVENLILVLELEEKEQVLHEDFEN